MLDPAVQPTETQLWIIRRCGRRAFGGEMSDGNPSGYLPGDPRYGLQGEAVKDYYRTKPAQWAIDCWDKPGTAATRRALLAEQKSYIKKFRRAHHRLRPLHIRRRPRSSGHLVLHAARRPRGGR